MSDQTVVTLSPNTIRDLANATAEALGGSGLGTGSVGGAGGSNNRTPRASDAFVNNLLKGLTGFGAGLDRTFGQLDAGATGLSTFNGALQGSASFFTKLTSTLSSKLPGLATVLGTTTDMLSEYAQQVNILADAQLDTYQNLSKVGGADQISGLTGVMDTFNKFGYTSKADFPKLTALVQENAQSFASFGGTVETGMKQFANVSAIMQKTGMQTELLLMGMKPDEINKSFAAMVKSVQMAGGSINSLGKTEEERAKSVKEYIKQQDIITRLTGVTADQQQKAVEQAMSNDRYAVRKFQLEQERDAAIASGDTNRIEAAKAAIAQDSAFLASAKKMGPEAFAGMQDLLVNANTDAALKLRFTLGEEFTSISQRIPATFKEYEENLIAASQAGAQGGKNFLDTFGENIKADTTGRANFGLKVQETLAFIAQKLTRADLDQARAEANRVPGQAIPTVPDPVLANMIAVMQDSMRTSSAIMNINNAGMRPITDLMVDVAAAIRAVAEGVPGATPKFLEANKALFEMMQKQQGKEGIGVGRATDQWLEDQRKNANEAADNLIDKAKEKAKAAAEATSGFMDTIKEFGENIPGALRDATKKLKEAGEQFREQMDIFRQQITPNSSTSGVNLNFSTMARLLNDYRNAAGPNNNYRPSLVDTVYRPNTEENLDTQYAAAQSALAGVGTGTEMSREQMVAYQTMIQQQSELIDLLQRSVGIQDKTLRATYNT